ncbi:putative trans-acting enoyl reductase Rv2449c [Convolutriloba macropyga]|uniref:putative trans-acting enoyl reductase Rv2449c n=1 Tax=Convolutriloba macropyga TaxID=536237 RepID=UPI003F51C49C
MVEPHKQLDLVVYGATGYTGKLACEYLASKDSQFQSSFKWAIAGRNQEKLKLLRSHILDNFKHVQDLRMLVADSNDIEAIDLVSKSSKAVISFAGPYSKWGTNLVESCVRNGSHYSDVTGELFWVSEMMEKFEQEAQIKRVKLIPTCGLGSMPFDWGVKNVVQFIKQQFNEDTKYVRGVIMDLNSTLSGGTAASHMQMVAPENIAKTLQILRDPQSMNPKDSRNNLDKPDPDNVVWDSSLRTYLAPFLTSPTNSRVVRRSNALNNYGPEFTYDEFIKANSWSGAKAMTWAQYLLRLSFANRFTRSLVQRALPDPGEGASMDELMKGHAFLKFYGESAVSGQKVVCDLRISGNPGYLIVARMLAEAGIDMAKNSEDMNKFGFQTPCSGLSPEYFAAMLENGISVETSLME